MSAENATPTALAVRHDDESERRYDRDHFTCLYRSSQAFSSLAVNLFFGEIDIVGLENIPDTGPVILVGNHKNQFVDAMIVVATVKRKVAFLIAEKSMHRRIIGDGARAMGSIPVIRPFDRARASPGVITHYDPTNNRITGQGCAFNSNVKPAEMIVLTGLTGVAPLVIVSVESDDHVIVKPPVKDENQPDAGQVLTSIDIPSQGITFKVIPKIDQREVFNKVEESLCKGRCIAIFPEGGSSDRTDLLPLKAGVSVVALGAASRGAPVKIVPFGINYNEGSRFRSKVFIDVGKPLDVDASLLASFQAGEKRPAQAALLKQIEQALRSVTFNAPDKHTLSILRTMRRLYQGRVKLPAKRFMELNRRFALAFGKFRDDERFLDLVARVHDYMLKLKDLRVLDRHVAELPPLGSPLTSLIALGKVMFTLLQIAVVAIIIIPCLLPYIPATLRTRYVASTEAKKALAGSTVKVKGEDVEASQKIFSTFIWGTFTNVVLTALSIGLTVGLWPRTSPYPPGSAMDGLFQNAIWLIPLATPITLFLMGIVGSVGAEYIIRRARFLPLYMLIVTSACRRNSPGARIRARRRELMLRIQEFVDKIISPAFPEWDEDPIITRDVLLAKRRKSEHKHAVAVAEEIDELAKNSPLEDSPSLANSRKTITKLKESMYRMEEDAKRYAATSPNTSPKLLGRQMSYGLQVDKSVHDDISDKVQNKV